MKPLLETDEQKTVIQYLRLKKIHHFAIVNENNHSKLNRLVAMKIEAKNKAMGKIKGVSDLVVFTPNKILFIEMKRTKGSTTSKQQKEFLEKVSLYPYAVGRVCKGAGAAIEFIEEYL